MDGDPPFDIYERTFQFACRILRMDRALARDRRVNRRAMSQLVDAAGSVGANLEEARAGQSKADFYAKLRISLKEARESYYWLRLLSPSSPPSQKTPTPKARRPLAPHFLILNSKFFIR